MDFIRRIIALTIKEFIMILKDPKSRFVIIGPPLIQFFVFGYAATYDLKNVSYAVFDESRTPESRELLSRFEGSENFELTKTLLNEKEIAFMINREKVRLVIHIGPEFSRNIHNGRPATLQVIVDGRNSNVALIALGYIGNIVETYNQDLVKEGVVDKNGPGVVLVDRAWFNANLQSRWFIVSALGGIISMVVVMILTSLSVAREREFGTFDQLLVAPFNPGEILVGKSLPGRAFIFGRCGLLVRCAVSRKRRDPCSGTRVFHPHHRGGRSAGVVPVHDHAAGPPRVFCFHDAVGHSFRIRHPHRKYAPLAPGWNFAQSLAPHRHRFAQHISGRRRCEHDLGPALAVIAHGLFYAVPGGVDVPAPVAMKLLIRQIKIPSLPKRVDLAVQESDIIFIGVKHTRNPLIFKIFNMPAGAGDIGSSNDLDDVLFGHAKFKVVHSLERSCTGEKKNSR
jgi:hypothetical protein